MHKVLKDYLMTSRGDLLRVTERIEQMVKRQYSKYRKELAASKHSVKFGHSLESMPFLPPGIHDILTPQRLSASGNKTCYTRKNRDNAVANIPALGCLRRRMAFHAVILYEL